MVLKKIILWGLKLSQLLATREPQNPWLAICYCKEVVGTKGYAINIGGAVVFHQRSHSYCSSAVNFHNTV